MRLRQQTIIDRPVERVWPYVVRPELFRRWNSKVSAMDATGEFRLGQPFTSHYQWHGKSIQCASIATEREEGRLLELRHSGVVGPGVPPDIEIRERITLEPRGGRTVVTKVVTIDNDGVPWLLRPLIWFVTRFGAPTERDPLKVLCESEAP